MPGKPPGSGDPLDPDGLVGRAAGAAAIRRMLDGAALVTVTGLPGVGKTAASLLLRLVGGWSSPSAPSTRTSSTSTARSASPRASS